MSTLAFTYEIISVDEASRCMEVVYISPVHGSRRVGVRLPYEGESLESVISMFSPVWEWRRKEIPVVVPKVGDSGELVDAEPAPAPLAEQVINNRFRAFQSEADPLFFKWQAGEATREEWEAKRAEIRARYPYPEE